METIYPKNVSMNKMTRNNANNAPRQSTGTDNPSHADAQNMFPYRAPLEIVKGISGIFLRYGLRSSSMNDICNHLKISKKTLYSYFDNKDQVVEAVMFYRRERFRAEDLIKQTEDVPSIRLVIGIAENISECLKSLWPINIFDMKKYHPVVYEKLMKQDNSHIDRCLQFLFRKGWQEGMFRKNIDAEMQTELLQMQISHLLDPENWPDLKHPAHLIVLHVFENFIRSIATPQGIAEFEKFVAETKGKITALRQTSGNANPFLTHLNNVQPTDPADRTGLES